MRDFYDISPSRAAKTRGSLPIRKVTQASSLFDCIMYGSR